LAEEGKMVYEPLPIEVIGQLQSQRDFVKSLVSQHLPNMYLNNSKEDLYILQAILDKKLLSKQQTWELQSLGVVFGDVLANEIGDLKWWQVTDDYGTDPVLRYKETTLQIGALTMISKRVEDNGEIDVVHMSEWLKEFVESKAHEYK